MRIVQDFKEIEALLARKPLSESFVPGPGMKKRLAETFGRELTPQEAVREVITRVRTQGDAALLDYTWKLDRVKLKGLEVTPEEIARARTEVKEELVGALKLAAQNIERFHRQTWCDRPRLDAEEAELGYVWRSLERVGVYVPGGTACYPSTVLMTAIPARVAGVGEIVMATPPKGDGSIPPATLVAAGVAGVGRIFKIGGAQAIAALAYGTESVPRVDKICGPGNIFVMLAKKEVYGDVAIDGLQGPTEAIVVADGEADPALCAADLLAQAEHDVLATPVLITTSRLLADRVRAEVERQLASLGRKDLIAEALESRGLIGCVDSVEKAVKLVNAYAPEHVSLQVKDGRAWAGRIKNAGAIFVGASSPMAIGDYTAGPSHVLPTGGTARFGSPLGVGDFLKATSLIAFKEAARESMASGATIARTEGLEAHARSLEMRLKGSQ